jgi:acetyl esterase/lipase
MPASPSLGFLRRAAAPLGALVATLVAACSPLALVNGLVPSDTYHREQDLAYGANERQRLDVYAPVSPTDAAPVIVFFYGGSWRTGRRADYRFVGEALASRGFVAVIADYRLYPEVRFPDFVADSARAVRWTRDNIARLGGDPERIFLMGHSAGGYNAAMLAFNPVYLRAAGFDDRAIKGFIGLAGPYDFLPLTSVLLRSVFGYPETSPTTQPINFVVAGGPPALLVVAAHDRIVDPGNSARLAARIRAAGGTVREVSYDQLDHRTVIGALAAPLRGLAPVLDDVAAFVAAPTR